MVTYSPEEKLAWIRSLHARASSATVLLTTDDDRLLVVKATYKDVWTPPGGVIDEGETPRVAAVRELYEETGIAETQYGSLVDVATVVYVSEVIMTYKFVFEARVADGVDLAAFITLPPQEIEAWKLVTREDVRLNESEYAFAVRMWADGQRGYIEHHLAKGE